MKKERKMKELMQILTFTKMFRWDYDIEEKKVIRLFFILSITMVLVSLAAIFI